MMLIIKENKNYKINLLKGSLIRNTHDNSLGMIIKNSFHEGYYYVFCKGRLEEWHISNIDVR